ncbi:MAG: hypothetical protein PF448_03090 [Bacteroidales bacterium]|jgi:hypothetical protein|nr:hypothetical protein [Bacteroidales bacterium]
MKIHKILRQNISEKKWNKCIENSENSRVYALSWYLDAVSDKQWDALVFNDYRAIMPLPYQKKFGIKIYAQPIFCQQLGIFWTGRLQKGLVDAFIKDIPGKFYLLSLNAESARYIELPGISYKPNFVLQPIADYQKLLKIMRSNHRRNIKKAGKQNLSYRDITTESYIAFKKSTGTKLPEKSWRRLQILLDSASQKNRLQMRGAFLDNQLISAVCWLEDFNRKVYLQAANNEIGKKASAAFGLVDEMVKQIEGSQLMIDFEGSTNPGVQRFYHGFGAKNEAYPLIESKAMQFLRKIRKS